MKLVPVLATEEEIEVLVVWLKHMKLVQVLPTEEELEVFLSPTFPFYHSKMLENTEQIMEVISQLSCSEAEKSI